MIVSIGDSYISGEGGRWAGNADEDQTSPWKLTDVGSDAYFPPGGIREQIPGCHRSRSAEIGIFPLARVGTAKNLACSGATTSIDASGLDFKPGIDFYNKNGHEGQALMLEQTAKFSPVRMVVLSIGGNDFHFSDVIKTA